MEADDQKQNVMDGKVAISDRLYWYGIECFFLLIFLIEMFARMFYLQLGYFKQSANWLDFGLVVLNIIDTLVLQPVGGGGDLRMFTILRIVGRRGFLEIWVWK